MTVAHTLRIDEDLDQRVRAEARRRHKGNLSDMFRDLLTHGFLALPPVTGEEDLSPMTTEEINAALAAMDADDRAEHRQLTRAATRHYPKGKP